MPELGALLYDEQRPRDLQALLAAPDQVERQEGAQIQKFLPVADVVENERSALCLLGAGRRPALDLAVPQNIVRVRGGGHVVPVILTSAPSPEQVQQSRLC